MITIKFRIFWTIFSRLSLIVGVCALVCGIMCSTLAGLILGFYFAVSFFIIAILFETYANSIKRDVEEAKRMKLRMKQQRRLAEK